MPDLLTTDEAADLSAALASASSTSWWRTAPCPAPRSPAAGCFPKAALDRWLAAGLVAPAALARAPAPPIVGGSHDPLLEWALRESGSGLASLPEGSEAGLRAAARAAR